MVFIFLNVVIAVIFEKLEEQGNVSGLDLEFIIPLLNDLNDKWQIIDLQGTGFIPTKDFMLYLISIKAPLGFN